MNEEFRNQNMTPEIPNTGHVEYGTPHNDGGSGGGAERRESMSAAKMWVQEVRRQVDVGAASAFVHSRTNYDIKVDSDGDYYPVKLRDEGFRDLMHRGIDISLASKTRTIVEDARKKYQLQGREDLYVPGNKDPDTLYVTIIDPSDVNGRRASIQGYSESLNEITKDGQNTLIEIRYVQPKAETITRGDAEKAVYISASREVSQHLESAIRTGEIDPNELRDDLGKIFTDNTTAKFYDMSLIEEDGDSRDFVAKKTPDKPNIQKIYLARSLRATDPSKVEFVSGESGVYEYIPNSNPSREETPVNPTIPETAINRDEQEEDEDSFAWLYDIFPDDGIEDDGLDVEPMAAVAGGDGGELPPNDGEGLLGDDGDDEENDEGHDPDNNSIPSVIGFVGESPTANPNNIGDTPIPFEGGHEFTNNIVPHTPIEKGDLGALGPREVLRGIENKSMEEQLVAVRELLNRLESNDNLTKEAENPGIVAALEARINQMKPEVAAEVGARLRLKDSALLAGMITSPDENTIQRYRDLYSEEERNKNFRLLKNEDMNRLWIEDHLNGIPIGKTYEYLEKVAFEGIRLSNGETRRYGDSMTSNERVEFNNKVDNQIIRMTEEMFPAISREEAIQRALKAKELAEDYATATFEIYVWMFGNVMKNPIAQSFYLREARERGDHGPLIHQRLIMGLGSSWPRQLQFKEKFTDFHGKRKQRTTYFFHSDKWERVKRIDGNIFAAHAIHKLQRVVTPNAAGSARLVVSEAVERAIQKRRIDNPEEKRRQIDKTKWEQTFEQFRLIRKGKDFNITGEDEYTRYLVSYIPKVLKARELLLTENWDIKDLLNRDKVNSNYGTFNKVDPTGRLELKRYFLAGAIDSLLTGGVLTHMGGTELRQLVETYIKPFPYYDERTGTVIQDRFITKEEMLTILDDLRAWHRGGMNEAIAKLEGIVQTAGRR